MTSSKSSCRKPVVRRNPDPISALTAYSVSSVSFRKNIEVSRYDCIIGRRQILGRSGVFYFLPSIDPFSFLWALTTEMSGSYPSKLRGILRRISHGSTSAFISVLFFYESEEISAQRISVFGSNLLDKDLVVILHLTYLSSISLFPLFSQ